MKSLLYTILMSTFLMSNILSTLDIEAAPLAMDLTADLEERILRNTERDLEVSNKSLFFYFLFIIFYH